MNKTVITNATTEFEANILSELLKQNGIEAEIAEVDGTYSIMVSDIDKNNAETIVNNYSNADNKKEIKKTDSLKSSLIKMAIFIGGAVLFYYIMSLIFKLILKLF